MLHCAARAVWREGEILYSQEDGPVVSFQHLYRPAQLLTGLCLEVTLKGLLVEREPELVSGGKIDPSLATHSLETLFRAVKIDLADTEEELNLVRKLSDGVEWVSRYPVPTKASALAHSKHQAREPFIKNDLDFERFEKLRDRIIASYEPE